MAEKENYLTNNEINRIIERIKSGDNAAWERLCDNFKDYVHSRAWNKIKSFNLTGEQGRFEEELPSKEEYDEVWKNLQSHNDNVDCIISHNGPYEVVTKIGYLHHDEEFELLRFFQQIADKVKFKDWYFGHLHKDVDIDNFHCRIDEVTQIEQ